MATIGSGSSRKAPLAVPGVRESELGSDALRALRRALVTSFAIAATWAATTPAHAQEAEPAAPPEANAGEANDRSARARSAYLEGVQAFEAERYDEALARFEAAYELERLPGLLFNQASALDRLGRVDEAVVRYEAYLAALPAAANGAYVQSRLTLLRAELERNAAADASADEPSASAETTPAPPDPAPTNARPLVGPLVTFGVALAAGAAAVGTGVRALRLRDALDEVCDEGTCPEDEAPTGRSMGRFARTTDVLLGVAGAAAITGLLWLLLGGADDDAASVSASLDRQGGEAHVRWRF